MRVRLKDIAEKCGVSPACIGYILSGNTRYKFRQETIDRVRKTARELGYRPNQMAKNLRKQENKIILCVCGNVCQHSDVEHLKCLELELGLRGYNLMVQFLVDLPEEQKLAFLKNVINWPAGIVILALGIHSEKGIKQVQEIFANAPPTISIMGQIPEINADYIRIKWGNESLHQVLDDFRLHGFKTVGCCLSAEEYRRGILDWFPDLCRERELTGKFYYSSPSDNPVSYFDFGVEIAKKILEEEKLPEALYCTSDEMAFSIIEVLRLRGVRVPENIYMIGGGDSEFCRHLASPLPVIVHDIPEVAAAAAADLVRRIELGETICGNSRCVCAIGRHIYRDRILRCEKSNS